MIDLTVVRGVRRVHTHSDQCPVTAHRHRRTGPPARTGTALPTSRLRSALRARAHTQRTTHTHTHRGSAAAWVRLLARPHSRGAPTLRSPRVCAGRGGLEAARAVSDSWTARRAVRRLLRLPCSDPLFQPVSDVRGRVVECGVMLAHLLQVVQWLRETVAPIPDAAA